MRPNPTIDPSAAALRRPRALVRRVNVDPLTGLCPRGGWFGGGSGYVFGVTIMPPDPAVSATPGWFGAGVVSGRAYEAWTIRCNHAGEVVSAVREMYPNVEFVSKIWPRKPWDEEHVETLERSLQIREAMRQDMIRGKTPGGRGAKKGVGKLTQHAGRGQDVVAPCRRREGRS